MGSIAADSWYIHQVIISILDQQKRHHERRHFERICEAYVFLSFHQMSEMTLSQSNTFNLNRDALRQLVYGNTTYRNVISIFSSSPQTSLCLMSSLFFVVKRVYKLTSRRLVLEKLLVNSIHLRKVIHSSQEHVDLYNLLNAASSFLENSR